MTTTFPFRRVLASVGTVLLVGASACDDPFEPKATLSVSDASHVVWAISGTPTTYPTALLVAQRLVVRADPAGSFDLAFDITGTGQVQILPVDHVLSPLSGPRPVDFIVATLPFAGVESAPRLGWLTDTTLTLDVGDTFLVRAQTLYCAGDFNSVVYAKYHVDSVFPAERRIRLTARVNPNCGFRSFATGIPTF